MKISNVVAAAALALCASQAGAVAISSVSAVTAGNYSAFAVGGGITGVTGFAVASTSIDQVQQAPLFDTGSFSVVTVASPVQTGTLTFAAGVTSFTFLWGSPDAGNSIVGTDNLGNVSAAIFGTAISDGLGDNSQSKIVTLYDADGIKSLTFTTTKVAFEVAAVPEPETYALMLAGLGAIGWVARRRKSV